MDLAITSIASSSAGNSYLISSSNCNLLLDCGISYKRIKEYLKFSEISKLDGILITHEHSDHISGLKTFLKKEEPLDIYMSLGTYQGIKSSAKDIYLQLQNIESLGKLHFVEGESEYIVSDISIRPFHVSHDTNDPFAYSFYCNGKQLSVVTDTGYVSDEVFNSIKGSDLLVIESNHEPNILLYGTYPYRVKQRILSDYGHLSNEACANCLVKILEENKKHPKVYLAHLSSENNTPEQAKLTVTNMLYEAGYIVGRDLELETLKKDEASKILIV